MCLPTLAAVTRTKSRLQPLWMLALAGAVRAAAPSPPSAPAVDAGHVEAIRSLAAGAAGQLAQGQARVEVKVGDLDPRWRLATCTRVEPFLPAGHRPWGRTRVGLRCLEGSQRWSVTLPVLVSVHVPGVVASQTLPAGVTLSAAHLRSQELDWGLHGPATLLHPDDLVGRVLQRPVGEGAPLSRGDLRPRQWFAAGDHVRLVARGEGFRVESEGVAVTAGIEGQTARARAASGRILVGRPLGPGQLEVLPGRPTD